MAYSMAAILMTLSGLQGHSPTASLFRCDFSYNRSTVNKMISTDVVRRAVPLP